MTAVGRRTEISKKLYIIYIMNVADWVCTVVLLRSGGFFEANPLAAGFVGDLSLGFVMKCVVSAGIIWLLMRLVGLLSDDGLRTADRFISFGVGFYFLLCSVHIVNFVILFLR